MSVKIDKITSRASELGLSADDVATELHINPATYYRKLSRGGSTFTVEQAQILVKVLKFSKAEAIDIFFGN